MQQKRYIKPFFTAFHSIFLLAPVCPPCWMDCWHWAPRTLSPPSPCPRPRRRFLWAGHAHLDGEKVTAAPSCSKAFLFWGLGFNWRFLEMKQMIKNHATFESFASFSLDCTLALLLEFARWYEYLSASQNDERSFVIAQTANISGFHKTSSSHWHVVIFENWMIILRFFSDAFGGPKSQNLCSQAACGFARTTGTTDENMRHLPTPRHATKSLAEIVVVVQLVKRCRFQCVENHKFQRTCNVLHHQPCLFAEHFIIQVFWVFDVFFFNRQPCAMIGFKQLFNTTV